VTVETTIEFLVLVAKTVATVVEVMVLEAKTVDTVVEVLKRVLVSTVVSLDVLVVVFVTKTVDVKLGQTVTVALLSSSNAAAPPPAVPTGEAYESGRKARTSRSLQMSDIKEAIVVVATVREGQRLVDWRLSGCERDRAPIRGGRRVLKPTAGIAVILSLHISSK